VSILQQPAGKFDSCHNLIASGGPYYDYSGSKNSGQKKAALLTEHVIEFLISAINNGKD